MNKKITDAILHDKTCQSTDPLIWLARAYTIS